MFKIWFLVALISTPHTTGIKYHGVGGYNSLEKCEAQQLIYENYLADFELRLGTSAVWVESYCLEFQSFNKGRSNDV